MSGASTRSEPADAPPEVLEVVGHFGLAAGNANVIMQLARLPIGHGVARSRVDSGRVDKHPIKRLRTTVTYLSIALLGTDDERQTMRHEVNRAHSQVRSAPGDPVAYNAFDPELQLWVAACLYWGTADVYRKLHGHDLPPGTCRGLLPVLQTARNDAAGQGRAMALRPAGVPRVLGGRPAAKSRWTN